MPELMVRDCVLIEVIDHLTASDTPGSRRLRARLLDDVLASMTPAQVVLMKRWRSYVCKECGHTMEADIAAEAVE